MINFKCTILDADTKTELQHYEILADTKLTAWRSARKQFRNTYNYDRDIIIKFEE